MILAVIYFLAFCFLVSKLSFFRDNILSIKLIFGILALKCVGCFAYYWVYFCYYPAGFNGDSVSTLHDAKIMYDALPHHPMDYIKMVLGLHSDSDLDPLYEPYFQYIEKWGRADVTSDFFLNDNRTPIRINAIIMLISFGNYAVHGLVMLVLSFVGQFAFYKAFKSYFPNKELLFAIIIFLTPSVLFWTSGVLKEPIAIFLSGLFILSFMKLFIQNGFNMKYFLVCVCAGFMFLILKPYILILILIPLLIFACINYYKIDVTRFKKTAIIYAGALLICYGLGIVIIKWVFHKDVLKTIVVRQNDFVNLSRGGTFFLNDKYYMRLEFKDSAQYKLADKEKGLYQIKPHAQLMCWDLHNLRDTIYVTDNQDTSLYKQLSSCPPSGSAIDMDRLTYSFGSFAKLIPVSFFNVLCKPFFYDSRSILELMASFENLLFLLVFICAFVFKTKNAINVNVLLLCISIVITSFILIGLTTTVMGAIVRYRIPFIPFLLMIPLLYLDSEAIKKIPLIKHLVK